MVTFNDADSLVRFIEDKLPPKIYDELFKSKSTWTNKNGTLGESVSTIKPFAVYGKLKEL